MTVSNYKSVAKTAVELGDFTVLVGANGAGKSNFVDALRFVKDCVTDSVAQAVRNRGGINAVRRRSRGHPTNFGFRLRISLDNGTLADYSFEIKAESQAQFTVKRERCVVQRFFEPEVRYEVRNGEFIQAPDDVFKGIRIEPDSLALQFFQPLPHFRPLSSFLTNMGFYALVPDKIRELQEPDSGRELNRDGSNAAAVLREISRTNSESYERLCILLSKVVPGTERAEYLSLGLGAKETIRFKQDIGDVSPWSFEALNMSDGTLRVLGILLAVYQVSRPSLVVIEEPEATVHPAALDVVVDILRDGASKSQVLVTTHSPDILDHKAISDEELRFVRANRGVTTIAPIAEVTRDVIKDHLYTPGQLLSMGEIAPDEAEAIRLEKQLPLFGAVQSSVELQ